MNAMIKRMIRDTFHVNVDIDELKECNDIYSGCDKFYEAPDCVIGMLAIYTDFGPEELAEVVDHAERLYEAKGKKVYLCLAMDTEHRVTVREMEIKSDADFVIRLGIVDTIGLTLERVKSEVENGTAGDQEREVLAMLPMIAPRERRTTVRSECFKLLTQI